MRPDVGHFNFLRSFWPDLHALATEAERSAATLPAFAAIRLRGFIELMVDHLLQRVGFRPDMQDKLFDRLVTLQREAHLDAHVLAKFHTIRKLGNVAAHNGSVSAEQAESLIEDAKSLASWFCRRMRPEVASSTADTASFEMLPPSSDGREDLVHEEEGAETSPGVCPPRTRIGLRDAFEAELTADQEQCITDLEAFLRDDARRLFLLKGYAGTGKTFLAAGLTEYLLTQGRHFSLAAPTGRAAKAIGFKTRQPGRTLHSLIYNFSDMTEDVGDGADEATTFKMIAKIALNEHPVNAVYIVDEASLISNVQTESEFFRSGSGYLLQDLISYVGSTFSGNDRKIIFIGDPAQLPPVGMSRSPALDAAYLRQNFGLDVSEYELTEIVRQKATSAVLRNVMPLRECLAADRFSSLSFIYDEDVIRLDRDRVTDLYMKVREGRGSQAPIIVTHSNAEAAEFSRAIRGRLFPGRDFVVAGDAVIVAANGFCATHYIANGEMLRIESVQPTVESRSVQLQQKTGDGKVRTVSVVLRFRDVIVAMPQPEGDDLILSTKILDDFLHGDEAGLDPVQQRALYVDFLRRHKHIDRKKDRDEFRLALRSDSYFNALRLRFGYAITCHKAQGGEWSHVITSCSTNRNPRSADYFRWLYTAMTRTTSKLYLVDPPDIRPKPPSDPGGDWVTPSEWATQAEPVVKDHAPAFVKDGDAFTVLSPQAMSRQWLQDEVCRRLTGTGVVIEDVAHHPYREAYFFKRDAETARIDITYKGDWKVAGVYSPRPTAFAESVMEQIGPIVGLRPGGLPLRPGTVSEPTRPFLKDYHDRLVAALARRNVSVAELREQEFAQRYRLARGSDVVEVNVFYNGRDQIKSYRPVNPAPHPGPSLVALQDDVRAALAEVST